MAGHRIAHQRAAAFVGHMGPFHIRVFGQQGHGQVAQAAIANGAKADILFGLGRSHHVGKGFVFRVDVGGQHHGRRADQHQGHQIFFAVERHVGVQAGVDPVGVKHHRKGVAVGRCLHHRCCANHAGCATAVFHNHALAQLLRQRLGDDARHLIDRAARRKHRHQFDGLLARPGLRQGQRGQTQCRHRHNPAQGGCPQSNLLHDVVLQKI